VHKPVSRYRKFYLANKCRVYSESKKCTQKQDQHTRSHTLIQEKVVILIQKMRFLNLLENQILPDNTISVPPEY